MRPSDSGFAKLRIEAPGEALLHERSSASQLQLTSLRFNVNLRVRELETTIDRLERTIRRQEPEIKRIFIEAESLKRGLMSQPLERRLDWIWDA